MRNKKWRREQGLKKAIKLPWWDDMDDAGKGIHINTRSRDCHCAYCKMNKNIRKLGPKLEDRLTVQELKALEDEQEQMGGLV